MTPDLLLLAAQDRRTGRVGADRMIAAAESAVAAGRSELRSRSSSPASPAPKNRTPARSSPW